MAIYCYGQAVGGIVFYKHRDPVVVVVVLVFYGPSTLLRSFRARSVNLSTLFLGNPPMQFASTYCTFFSQ